MENELFEPVIELLERLRRKVPDHHLNPAHPYVPIIDMGHGGIIDGKYTTAPDKMFKHSEKLTFYEGVYNRAVGYTWAYEQLCANRNYMLLYTGDEDKSISKYRNPRIRYYGNKFEREGYKVYGNSIHGNAFGVEEVNGVEVFTSPGNTKSDPIATIAYQKLMNMGWKMRPGMRDGDPDKEARFSILIGNPYPFVLHELGFYTNEEQAKEMCNPETIGKIALLLTSMDLEVERLKLLR